MFCDEKKKKKVKIIDSYHLSRKLYPDQLPPSFSFSVHILQFSVSVVCCHPILKLALCSCTRLGCHFLPLPSMLCSHEQVFPHPWGSGLRVRACLVLLVWLSVVCSPASWGCCCVQIFSTVLCIDKPVLLLTGAGCFPTSSRIRILSITVDIMFFDGGEVRCVGWVPWGFCRRGAYCQYHFHKMHCNCA